MAKVKAVLKEGSREVLEAYRDARPDPLGNLHQRMKAVMKFAQEAGIGSEPRRFNDLSQAIWDLQTEVMNHVPGSPPFGHRSLLSDELERACRYSWLEPKEVHHAGR